LHIALKYYAGILTGAIFFSSADFRQVIKYKFEPGFSI
jgi:hypothetical protein